MKHLSFADPNPNININHKNYIRCEVLILTWGI